MARARPWVPCGVALGLLVACATEAERDGDRTGSLPSDTVEAALEASIGGLDGATEYLLGDVTSVAASEADILYVADRIGSTVRAYDATGRYLTTVAVEGEGPGELNWPSDLTFDTEGRLYVRDRVRLTVFGPRPGTDLADSLIRTTSLGGAQTGPQRGRTDGSLYYLPSYYYFMFVNHRYFYLVVDSLGLKGDTLPVPSVPSPEIFGRTNYLAPGGQFGIPVEGVNVAPFEAVARWDVTVGGRVVVTPGDRYEVTAWGPQGDAVRIVSAASERRRVPLGAARDSARAFRARLDSIPVPLDEVQGMSDQARSGRLPDLLPEVVALQVDLVGNLWLRRWPPDDAPDHTVFDVFDERGAPIRTVRIPAPLALDPAPWLSGELVVGVRTDPLTGVETVLSFRLEG